MPQSYLRDLRVIDNILTKVVLGYNLEQQFTGQHLFPDVSVPQMGGKILKFGKEAYIVRNTVRAPGETVRDIGFAYSSKARCRKNLSPKWPKAPASRHRPKR